MARNENQNTAAVEKEVDGPRGLKRMIEQAEANGEEGGNQRPKNSTAIEDYITPVSDFTLLKNSYDIWLNLPDIPFDVIMMSQSTTQLRILTQVSSSWRKRITKNILENQVRKTELRVQSERALGPRMLPSKEEITNAMWLVHIGILDIKVIKIFAACIRKQVEKPLDVNFSRLIECAAKLAHHHLLGGVKCIVLGEFFTGDLSTVPTPHLASLVSTANSVVHIVGVTGCDLVAIFDSLLCRDLRMDNQKLGKDETQALVRAMETRVEQVYLSNVDIDIEALTKYSGRGVCYFSQFLSNTEEVKGIRELVRWASKNEWHFSTMKYPWSSLLNIRRDKPLFVLKKK